MTTIIISVLAALGIGGGVMLASSGGGGGHSGGAVVGPSIPGGGSSGGGEIGGGTSGGGGTSTQIGSLILSNPNSLKTMGLVSSGNTTIENNTLTMGISAFAPVLQSENTYTTTEVTRIWHYPAQNYYTPAADYAYYINYGNQPTVFASFDLSQFDPAETYNNTYADFYAGQEQSMQVPVLYGKYIRYGTLHSNVFFTSTNWSFKPTLALGGRRLGLQNSDFGYIKYSSSFNGGCANSTGGGIPSNVADFFKRSGAQQFYMFDTSKQIMASQYAQKYNSAEVTFSGRTIGAYHLTNTNCAGDGVINILGDISLTLNFANNTFRGDITHLKPYYNTINVNMYNFELHGNINAVNSNTPNLTFTSVTPYGSPITNGWQFNPEGASLEVKPIINDGTNNFGYGVLVEGPRDETVGEIAFAGPYYGGNNSYTYYHLAFGAKKE